MLSPIIRILRPRQWLKNAVVLAPLVFAQKLGDAIAISKAIGAFSAFCVLSSAVYVFNDLAAVERDRNHTIKCRRPLPSGELSKGAAWALGVVLVMMGSIGAWCLSMEMLAVSLSYVVLVVAYSLFFKKIVVLDVMVLALGFVLRAVAGAVAINADVSPWLVVCTLLLAMFIALGKRRHEFDLLDAGAAEHRPVLGDYTPHLLDQMIAIICASTIMAYSLYTMSKRVKQALCPVTGQMVGPLDRQHLMAVTIPFVLYGLFRYLYLIHRRDLGGAPEKVLFLDVPLLIAVLLWMLAAAWALYTGSAIDTIAPIN